MPNFVFYEDQQDFISLSFLQCDPLAWLGIQIQKGSCTFDKVSKLVGFNPDKD